MMSTDFMDRYRRYLSPSTLTYYEEPIVVDRAKGVRVTDVNGESYLDFFGGILTVSLEHGNEHINNAVKVQLDHLSHISTLYPTAPVLDVAEALAKRAPGNIEQSFFVSSGTAADEMAVMLAMSHTGSSELIALRNGYAGRSMLAQALTAQSSWRVLPTQIAGIKHAHAPYCYRCDFGLTPDSCGLACAKDIENLIKYTTTGKIAGFLAEPIQGVGGFIVPPEGYFEVAVGIVKKYGGLFIADEVQTGFGRTGGKFWGIEHFGVEPDIMTMAKGMANGLPAGNCMTTPEIAACLPEKGMSISTFGANPLSMAAAKATIEVIDAEDILMRSQRLGEVLSEGLKAIQGRFPVNVGDVRGMGLMQAIELVVDEPGGNREPETALTGRIFEEAKKRGVLLGKGGLFGNVFRVAPPMLISQDELEHGLKVLEESLAVCGAR
jgi:4-aminobutyrate aminotransferase-like enzyme